MATTTDPVEALSAVVNRLYDLSASSQVTPAQKTQLAAQADELSDELSRLVQEQLDATDAAYQSVMVDLTHTTNALNQAEAKIQGLVADVNGAAEVAASVDNLIQQAVALGQTVAKVAA